VDIAQSQGQNRLGGFSFRMFVLIRTLKRQQVEVCPTCWKDHICDLLQRHQCGCAPLMPSSSYRNLLHRFVWKAYPAPQEWVSPECLDAVIQLSKTRNRGSARWSVHVESAKVRLHHALTPAVRE